MTKKFELLNSFQIWGATWGLLQYHMYGHKKDTCTTPQRKARVKTEKQIGGYIRKFEIMRATYQNHVYKDGGPRVWRPHVWRPRVWRPPVWRPPIWRPRIWRPHVWRPRIWCPAWTPTHFTPTLDARTFDTQGHIWHLHPMFEAHAFDTPWPHIWHLAHLMPHLFDAHANCVIFKLAVYLPDEQSF